MEAEELHLGWAASAILSLHLVPLRAFLKFSLKSSEFLFRSIHAGSKACRNIWFKFRRFAARHWTVWSKCSTGQLTVRAASLCTVFT